MLRGIIIIVTALPSTKALAVSGVRNALAAASEIFRPTAFCIQPDWGGQVTPRWLIGFLTNRH